MNKKKSKKKNGNHQNINTAPKKDTEKLADAQNTADNIKGDAGSGAVGAEKNGNHAAEEAISGMKADEQKVKNAETTGAENKTESPEVQAEPEKKENKPEIVSSILNGREITSVSADQIKAFAVSALKILLPVAACAIVIAFIISLVGSRGADSEALNPENESVELTDEPLLENAYDDVNELMNTFFKALADADMETIALLRDYNDDTSLITYEKRSEFIDEYLNVTCYTKPGLEDDSYFVYVSYDVKVTGIETTAPGLNAFYVYTTEDGSLIIDGDMDEQVDAAFKLVTNQDDVVDLYNRIDVSYNEAVASDEELNTFMAELPGKVKTSVGEALAQAQAEEESTASDAETESADAQSEEEQQSEAEEQTENQTVNQIVRATDTVNVRKSDSEEADRIGKVTEGTQLTRIEDRINGWSKVIYEGSEAYIKSDYLEVVSTQAEEETVIGSVKAVTNVNVRSAADQDSEKLGLAEAETSYELLEDLGEWYKIQYNGMTGYVKAEFFEAE
ncbi:MAG: SH3 domain-containing protein [Lachnospiraceae bacterium]|nr:SH3 domain-containing protein [Lachnospiraceae bacterium]